MKYPRYPALFFSAGGAYVALELAWRGRSHISMFAAGGLSAVLIHRFYTAAPSLPGPVRALGGGAIITAVELATGLAVNRDYRVWDYRDMPGNFRGQICPVFTALWMPVALAGMWLYGWLDRKF